MTYTKEQVIAAYNRLPQVVKEIFGDIQTEDDVVEIGHEHNLHIDQIGKLNQQVTLVLLGLEPVSQFTNAIKGELNLDQATATEIADKINRAIFLKVHEELRSVTSERLGEAEAARIPSADEVLNEIEHPRPTWSTTPSNLPTADNQPKTRPNDGAEQAPSAAPAGNPGPDLFEQKLSQTFVLPRVESATKEDTSWSAASTPAGLETKALDPYRESLN